MSNPRDILNTYINFRKKIKQLLNSTKSSIEQCIIITKEDMAYWKEYYEYSKSLINNNSLINSWESGINAKYNIREPTFHVLTGYKAIKSHLSKEKGISFVNQEFINYFIPSQKYGKFNCYIGNKKIVIEFSGDFTVGDCLICKIGSKSSLEYIIYETIQSNTSSNDEPH